MPQRKTAPNKTTTQKKVTSVEDGKGGVHYSISITKSTGAYESIKIQAGISIPQEATPETLKKLDDLIIVAKEKVVSRLAKDLDDITNTLT